MTALKLDARPPVIAIVGAFNPAIFTPIWIAHNLHGYPKGTEVAMIEALAEVPGGLAQLTFIDGIALTVSATRLDAMVLSLEEERLSSLDKCLTNLLGALPHTPLSGLGCNIQFFDDDPSDELLEMFNSPEGVEGLYTANGRQFAVQLVVDGGVLNFSRAEDNGAVRFSFNYHYSLNEPVQYAEIIPGIVQRSEDHAAALLASLYGLSEFEIISYMQVSEQETNIAEARQNPVLENQDNAIGAG